MIYLTLWKHGFLQNWSSWLTEIYEKCFKSARGSVALKKNSCGIHWNIPPGTQNLHLIELNCQYSRRWNSILYIQLLKSYVIVIIPCGHQSLIIQSFYHGSVCDGNILAVQAIALPQMWQFSQKCNFLESPLTFSQFSLVFIFGALITLWSLIFCTIGKN